MGRVCSKVKEAWERSQGFEQSQVVLVTGDPQATLRLCSTGTSHLLKVHIMPLVLQKAYMLVPVLTC